MPIFTAHYLSPKANKNRVNGLFDFESANRMGTKAIMRDARLAMLERFGNDSLSWNIDNIYKKKKKQQADGQLMLDFRPAPKERKRKKSKGWW